MLALKGDLHFHIDCLFQTMLQVCNSFKQRLVMGGIDLLHFMPQSCVSMLYLCKFDMFSVTLLIVYHIIFMAAGRPHHKTMLSSIMQKIDNVLHVCMQYAIHNNSS